MNRSLVRRLVIVAAVALAVPVVALPVPADAALVYDVQLSLSARCDGTVFGIVDAASSQTSEWTPRLFIAGDEVTLQNTAAPGRFRFSKAGFAPGTQVDAVAAVLFAIPEAEGLQVSDRSTVVVPRCELAANGPVRVLDTHPTGATVDGEFQRQGRRPAGSTLELPISSRLPALSGDRLERGLWLQVTASGATRIGELTAWECGSPRPTTTVLVIPRDGSAVSGSHFTSPILGPLCLRSTVAAHLVVDVTGRSGPNDPTFMAALEPRSPSRLLDTRPGATTTDGQSAGIGVRPAGSTTRLKVDGRGSSLEFFDIGAVLTITGRSTGPAGQVTVWTCGTARPNVTSVSVPAGKAASATTVVGFAPDGTVCIRPTVAMHLSVDLIGGLVREDDLSLKAPRRFLDTRPAGQTFDGKAQRAGVRPAGSVTSVPIAGRGGIPTTATGALLSITAITNAASAKLTVWPCGTPRPPAVIDVGAHRTSTVAVSVPIGSQRSVCIHTSAPVQLLADTIGTIARRTVADVTPFFFDCDNFLYSFDVSWNIAGAGSSKLMNQVVSGGEPPYTFGAHTLDGFTFGPGRVLTHINADPGIINTVATVTDSAGRRRSFPASIVYSATPGLPATC
jgi:hypothetical protein